MGNNHSKFNFSNVSGSQINIAQDQAKIEANMNVDNVTIRLEQELNKLIQLVQESTELSQEEKDEIVRRGNEVLAGAELP